ncbi:hypothetical protein N7468_004306 [Penicillium chermesinum]|uniref:PEBP-like protein n=1 Tax=Penicillium chermesinum TaxID=63820 RepID=A0A9W9P8C3_9EURO|nr:uncharacterized protein N7468_004306 [Penicillium chermesinum]KAJ5239687.1 hypothetical protein N7468_004306 [Penicillium chermesinum]
MLKYVEYGISRLLASAKGRDAGLFTKTAAFSKIPKPTFQLSCPEVGPPGSQMLLDHSADGKGRFPSLTWEGAPPDTKEFLLVSEDPDAPLSRPSVHGIYYGISPAKTSVGESDFAAAQSPYALQGGFKYGKNRRGIIYIPPRPLVGHGPHRYFFTIVALSQPVDTTHLSALPSIDEIAKDIEGKVLGWGEWTAVYERKWE